MSLISYETANPRDPEWTDTAYELIEAGKLTVRFIGTSRVPEIQVSGPCPRCGDTFVASDVLVATLAGEDVLGLERLEDATYTEPGTWRRVTVTCECTGIHDGRPRSAPQGCGISYVIEVDEVWT
jgi:hypothetical protein